MNANDDPSGNSEAVSFRLRWIAIALFGAYLFSVVAESLPLRIADTNWHLNVATTLVDNATIPLIGLGIVHLVVYLDPDSPAAQALLRRVSHLAVLASLGFLLIIPLQIGSSVKLYTDLSATRFKEINRADQRLLTLASQVQSSTTVDQLESTLLTLQGSALSDNDRSQPLASLKRLVLNRIREARKVLQAQRRQLKAAAPLDPTLLVRRSLRIVLTSLVFSLAFAAGSQLPNSPFSLLEDWQISGLRLEEWWVRSRAQHRERQAEKREQRQDQQRIAAFEALRQDGPPEPLEPQEAELAPWFQSPLRSDLDYLNRLIAEDPTNGATADPQAEVLNHQSEEAQRSSGPPVLNWWLRIRETLRGWQAERMRRRQERQRIAALQALSQWWPYDSLDQQEAEAELWDPPPDWRLDRNEVSNLRHEDPADRPAADPQVELPRSEAASDTDPPLPPSKHS